MPDIRKEASHVRQPVLTGLLKKCTKCCARECGQTHGLGADSLASPRFMATNLLRCEEAESWRSNTDIQTTLFAFELTPCKELQKSTSEKEIYNTDFTIVILIL